ncbi:hypothetical protein [Desulfatitalea alkaliphila]|uniref:Uncharacterized protein n=1 Tax=Desulfatitalea alkaliphila TaxID=2929485 RepID=A0AA41R7P1_9BACT|nr:hypothetical protein [Desulfatitalea alkaliphila]MCJ8503073.1 hypothetical protein [Desulfatitalea alkaliphila]
MELKEKQMAAALAAVAAYMQMEEESYHQQVAAIMAPPPAPAPCEPPNLWGQSGRQSMMQLRSLMQLKTFARIR